jgi:hypothetical protein
MRRSSDPGERTQFTVAELLARCGEAPPTTGRRRRRAAEEPDALEDTVAHPVVPQPTELNGTGSRREPTARSSGPARAPDGSSAQPSRNSLPHWAPAVGPPSSVRKPESASPPAVAELATLSTPALSTPALRDGPVTDQLPRYDPGPAGTAPPWSSRQPVTTQLPAENTQLAAEKVRLPAGLGTRAIPEQHGTVTPTAEVDTEVPQPCSPWWEWAAMMSQVGLGVVGGATLWLICEWLWQRIPVVGLVVALAVITGLVYVVRRVRRAEDLQTTVIAVLVGLFVTVSPAALLLVGR